MDMAAIVAEKSNQRLTGSSLTIDVKAWFLCRFLCRDLTEENFEKVRVHLGSSSSSSKGVKTKVKLSPNGWRVGYKRSHVRHLNQKLPYETLPLEFVEVVFQDSTYVNVLLCVIRLRNISGMRFEITAYKFSDPETARRIGIIFQVLVGNRDEDAPQIHPIPSRSYPLRPLPIYGRSRHAAALPLGADVRGKTATTGPRSQSTTDESIPSYGSSDVVSYCEVAVTAYLDKSPTLFENKAALMFHRYGTYLCDGVLMADVACQVTATEESRGRSFDGSTVDGPSSSGNWDVMTSTVRRIYNRTRVRRTPEAIDGLVTRTRSEHRLRWRSVEPLREDLRYLSVSRAGEHKSQPPAQSSYYLDGNFTKAYGPRRNQHVGYSGYAPVSAHQSSGYGGREIASTRRY